MSSALKIMPSSTFLPGFFFIHLSILLLISHQVQGTKSSSRTGQQLWENTQGHGARTGARSWVSIFPVRCGVGQDFFLSLALPSLAAQRCYSALQLGDLHGNRFVVVWLNLKEVVIVYEMSIKSWVSSSPPLDALENAVMKDRYTSMLGFPKELLFFALHFGI